MRRMTDSAYSTKHSTNKLGIFWYAVFHHCFWELNLRKVNVLVRFIEISLAYYWCERRRNTLLDYEYRSTPISLITLTDACVKLHLEPMFHFLICYDIGRMRLGTGRVHFSWDTQAAAAKFQRQDLDSVDINIIIRHMINRKSFQ